MKWLLIVLVIAAAAAVLWKSGYVDEFLRPWGAWAKWIGYFQ